MAIRTHNRQWTGVYRDDSNNYVGGTTIKAGGSPGYNTLIGFNSSAILDDINTSKVNVKVWLCIQVTDAGTFDFGMHKSSFNKASDGIPFYSWTGRSFIPNIGLARYDITNFNRSISGAGSTFKSALQNGYHGPVLYGPMSDGAYAEGSNVYIEIEGTWNNPPTKPNLTYPQGGETLGGTLNCTADPSTDPDGDQIYYQYGIRDGDGWHYTTRGSINRQFNLDDYSETSIGKIAIRAWDGQSYSQWDYSDVFTIQHNVPPSAPKLNSPVGGSARDRTKSVVFDWKHEDTDPQSKFNLRWRLQGDSTWNNIADTTTSTFDYLPPNTFPAGLIEWQVRTYDQGSLASPWSSLGVFLSTEKTDAPTIVSPTAGEIITQETFAIAWSSSDQAEYDVEILEGSSTHWSVSRVSGNKAVTIANPLINNTQYTARVRVRSEDGLWSDWAENPFFTSFTTPPQPIIEITSTNSEIGSITIEITNPLPLPEEPNVVSNTLLRRQQGGEWVRIGVAIIPDGTFVDYTPASNVVYEYQLTAQGDNGTSMDSVPVIGSVAVEETLLSLSNDNSVYVKLQRIQKRSFSLDFGGSEMKYKGRSKPVTEFSEMTLNDFGVEFKIAFNEYDKLLEVVGSKQTLLYRDKRGRKSYVTCSGLGIEDIMIDKYVIQLPLSEVYYNEEV